MKKQKIDNKLQEDFDQLQSRVVDLENQLKRAVADYQNLEKRVSEGRSELTSFVGAEIVSRMLPTLDHLEQALSGVTEQERASGWYRGVELAVKEFKNVLSSEGLEEISADGVFDPSLHEAVDTENGEENSIIRVAQKGYSLNGKVIRPAKVIVGRKES